METSCAGELIVADVSGGAGFRQSAQIWQAIEALDQCDDFAGARSTEDRVHQGMEFLFQAAALFHHIGGRDAGIVGGADARAIRRLDFHFGLGVRPAGLEFDGDFLAQPVQQPLLTTSLAKEAQAVLLALDNLTDGLKQIEAEFLAKAFERREKLKANMIIAQSY